MISYGKLASKAEVSADLKALAVGDSNIPVEVLELAKAAAIGLLPAVTGDGVNIAFDVNVVPPLNAAQIYIQITGKTIA